MAFPDAVSEMLGTPTLTAQQKTYLDDVGNRNGVFDLGDFLALVDRSGASASPQLMQRILQRQAAAQPSDSTGRLER